MRPFLIVLIGVLCVVTLTIFHSATPLAQATASGNLGLQVAVAVAVVGGGLVTLFIWRRGRP